MSSNDCIIQSQRRSHHRVLALWHNGSKCVELWERMEQNGTKHPRGCRMDRW